MSKVWLKWKAFLYMVVFCIWIVKTNWQKMTASSVRTLELFLKKDIFKAGTLSQLSMSQKIKLHFQSSNYFSTFNVPNLSSLPWCIFPFAHLWGEHQHINIWTAFWKNSTQWKFWKSKNVCTSVRRTSTYQHLDNFPLSSLTIQQNPSFRFAKTLVQATRYN